MWEASLLPVQSLLASGMDMLSGSPLKSRAAKSRVSPQGKSFNPHGHSHHPCDSLYPRGVGGGGGGTSLAGPGLWHPVAAATAPLASRAQAGAPLARGRRGGAWHTMASSLSPLLFPLLLGLPSCLPDWVQPVVAQGKEGRVDKRASSWTESAREQSQASCCSDRPLVHPLTPPLLPQAASGSA